MDCVSFIQGKEIRMIRLIRFGLFVVIISTSAILWFRYNSNWGTVIVLIGLVLDFCL